MLDERKKDKTVVEQQVACEAEDSTHSQEVLRVDATQSPLIVEKPAKQKKINELKNVAKKERQSLMVEESAEEASSKAAPKHKKKDQRKNMYGYSFKHIIRELFS